MTKKTIRKEEVLIMQRFFIAVYRLALADRIHSLSSFCDSIGLSSPMYRALRLSYGITPSVPIEKCAYKSIDIIAIYELVAHYRISSQWLFTGEGEMFKK